ncbi:MAG TPA: amidohydrolase family protein [Mycobacteriales bacterium]|nr:amidohydrolase family protein [Mycobacteriales bacterium]
MLHPGPGLALSGTIWTGGDAEPRADSVVLVDASGWVDRVGPAASVDLPPDVTTVGGAGAWVGPGVVDAHVHLAFGSPDEAVRHGVVGVRDLGAPPDLARRLRSESAASGPVVRVAGPLITAPGGYPSRSWGSAGFARFVDSPQVARAAVRELARDGVDLVKVALEPAGGQPVPSLDEIRAVVGAAHDAGLRVTAHALSAAMVRRALDAGVDELCHTPIELLDSADVERIAGSGVTVVSTLQTFCAGGDCRDARANASALVAAGVPLVYGTDLGNAGTRPGVDPGELRLLADSGLGTLGALRAATEDSARLVGGGLTGRIVEGEPATLVVLPGDPLADPELWRRPDLVMVSGRVELSTGERA